MEASSTRRHHPSQLALAAGASDEAEVEALLKAGRDANKATSDGVTPLIIAARSWHAGVARLLLNAKADADKAVAESEGVTPLLLAACNGHARVAELLLKAGADANKASGSGGATPLLMAASNGHREVVRLLLKAGADADVTTAWIGATPLIVASQEGHRDVVEQLLRAGAEVDKGLGRGQHHPASPGSLEGPWWSGGSSCWRPGRRSTSLQPPEERPRLFWLLRTAMPLWLVC